MSGRDDWAYEQYRLGELSAEEMRQLESREDFEVRMAEIEASDRVILARYSPQKMAQAIKERAAFEKYGAREDNYTARFRPSGYLIPLAAAAAVLFALILVFPLEKAQRETEVVEETLRIKGADVPDKLAIPDLILYRNGPEGVEVLSNGDFAEEHDLLQMSLMGGGVWQGVLLSVDGNGVVTRHWPLDGTSAVSLTSTEEFLLPFSYELDDAPEFEAFFLLWSDADFSIDKAEILISPYRGEETLPKTSSLNPGGKTGLTAIKLRKKP